MSSCIKPCLSMHVKSKHFSKHDLAMFIAGAAFGVYEPEALDDRTRWTKKERRWMKR